MVASNGLWMNEWMNRGPGAILPAQLARGAGQR